MYAVCAAQVHNKCAALMKPECELGVLREHILPPTAILPAVLDPNRLSSRRPPAAVPLSLGLPLGLPLPTAGASPAASASPSPSGAPPPAALSAHQHPPHALDLLSPVSTSTALLGGSGGGSCAASAVAAGELAAASQAGESGGATTPSRSSGIDELTAGSSRASSGAILPLPATTPSAGPQTPVAPGTNALHSSASLGIVRSRCFHSSAHVIRVYLIHLIRSFFLY